MATNVKYGFDGTVYFNSGTYGAPTWNLVSAIRDASVDATMSEVDASTRQGGGLTQSEPIMLSLGLTGKIRTDEADTTGYLAMESAFLGRTSLDILILDNPNTLSGARGYRFDAKCFKLGEDQALDNLLFREFELKPCVSLNAVKKAVVTAGSPVFTTLAM